MAEEDWWATVLRVVKSDTTERFTHTHTHTHKILEYKTWNDQLKLDYREWLLG